MKIRVNGEIREAESPCSVADMLDRFGYTAGEVAVAVNGEFVPRSIHPRQAVEDGDELDIVAPQVGG